jgi:HemY protein
LERETATQLLARNFPSFNELDEIWNALPKAARGQAPCLALYCQQLVSFGHHEEAEKLLRKSLTRQWHPDTVRQYGEVRIHNAALQLERAESWLVSRAEDVDLLLALAKLSVCANAWKKARAYVEQLIALAPSPIAYALLAEVHEQAGEVDDAALARRDGLALATHPVRSLAVLPT